MTPREQQHRKLWEKEAPEIPYGHCWCGCGERTANAPRTAVMHGCVRGCPRRYLFNHHRRKSPIQWIEEDRGYSTPCWIWQRATDGTGYGRMCIDGEFYQAHRVFHERKHGPIPAGKQLDHLCRQRPCINPDHTEPVTNAENTQRGNRAVLSWPVVREMRATGTRTEAFYRAAADRHGASWHAVRDVMVGKTWKEVCT